MESYEDDESDDMQEMFALTIIMSQIAARASSDTADDSNDLILLKLKAIEKKTNDLL
eukprot:CAMPEP_0116878102 /NCGR_PEP_ID=MMETSP0463-20121206/9841_1 /TAXON_ID=181622 /ORGANISM="Strombidinopsis sp, Strain SopsisLIS2011" /LENGTH=56 /DNA_ID=CAMNT_0004525965 /DNA_START=861 /DNA_END=1031 /DNA_ORIENTATION=+